VKAGQNMPFDMTLWNGKYSLETRHPDADSGRLQSARISHSSPLAGVLVNEMAALDRQVRSGETSLPVLCWRKLKLYQSDGKSCCYFCLHQQQQFVKQQMINPR